MAHADLIGVKAGLGAVGVLDDDESQARTVGFQLEDVGIQPVIANLDDVQTISQALSWIQESEIKGLICDVQLNNLHGGMQFDGAQLVAQLVAHHHIPCVLTTGFAPDVWMLVRPFRADIPVLLGRDETEDPVALVDGLALCATEISSGRGPLRRTHRVPLFIERVGEHDTALDARVGSWPYKTPMRFPATMLGPEYADAERRASLVGKVFFARVNIGAEREPDLFFEDPEVDLINPANLGLHFDEREM